MRSFNVIILSALAAGLITSTKAAPVVKRHDGQPAYSGATGPARGGNIIIPQKNNKDGLISVLNDLHVLGSKKVKAGNAGVSKSGDAYGGSGGSGKRDLLDLDHGHDGNHLLHDGNLLDIDATVGNILGGDGHDHDGSHLLDDGSLLDIDGTVDHLLDGDKPLITALNGAEVLQDESYQAGNGGTSASGNAYGGNGGSGGGAGASAYAGGNGGAGYSGATSDVSGGSVMMARSEEIDCAQQILHGEPIDSTCVGPVEDHLTGLHDNDARRSWLQNVVSGSVTKRSSRDLVATLDSTTNAVTKGTLSLDPDVHHPHGNKAIHLRDLTSSTLSTTECYTRLAGALLSSGHYHTSSSELELYIGCASELDSTLASLPDDDHRRAYLIHLAGIHI